MKCTNGLPNLSPKPQSLKASIKYSHGEDKHDSVERWKEIASGRPDRRPPEVRLCRRKANSRRVPRVPGGMSDPLHLATIPGPGDKESQSEAQTVEVPEVTVVKRGQKPWDEDCAEFISCLLVHPGFRRRRGSCPFDPRDHDSSPSRLRIEF